MLDWSELVGLRVIKRMAEVINQRWNIGVGFADNGGMLFKGPEFNRFATRRPVCDLIKSTHEGVARCSRIARLMIEQHANNKKPLKSACSLTCHAGLLEQFVPVIIDGDQQGLIVAGGFFRREGLESQINEVLARLSDLPLDVTEIKRACRETPVLSAESEGFLADLLELVVREILIYQEEVARKEKRLDRLTKQMAERSSYSQIIGKSEVMRKIYRMIDKVAITDSTALIIGENGTGKELIARAIHFNSLRRDKPFVVQNCSAFNDNLLDSELFGHSRGAFTGAVEEKKGLFEVADGGTFFLDEIGDMSPSLQIKLLRVLQEGTFIPVGSTNIRKVDVRIIAATNRDIRTMIQQGLFREDLYYRINVINIKLPPLRERREDIPLLVEHFLRVHSRDNKRSILSSSCMKRLIDYRWPGNVRELENEIERLTVLCDENEKITEEYLSPRIRYEVYAGDNNSAQPSPTLPEAIERLERTMLLDHLKRVRWNKTQAAKTLGISRRNLIRKVQAYELDRRRKNN